MKLIPFRYNSQEIRVVKDESGNPWWIARDICDILDISNITKAMEKIPEKHLTSLHVRAGGQNREMNAVDEPGLYRLILRSDKPQAEPFMEWITSEVLPQIRKTGVYSQNAECGKYPVDGFRNFTSVPAGMKYCAGCRQIFPSSKDFFYSNASKEDGLDNYCIPCKKIYRAKMRAATRPRLPVLPAHIPPPFRVFMPPVPKGWKRCNVCKGVFPKIREYFYSKMDGLYSDCIKCRRISRDHNHYQQLHEDDPRRFPIHVDRFRKA